MNTQHTPGPWDTETKGSKHFIDGADGLTVAYLDRSGVRERAEIEANIRLIAAAPELLAALKDLLQITLSRGEKLGLDDGGPVLDKARATIAKATQI
jgi:hypothetical protein